MRRDGIFGLDEVAMVISVAVLLTRVLGRYMLVVGTCSEVHVAIGIEGSQESEGKSIPYLLCGFEFRVVVYIRIEVRIAVSGVARSALPDCSRSWSLIFGIFDSCAETVEKVKSG